MSRRLHFVAMSSQLRSVSFRRLLMVQCVLSVLLHARPPSTNFILDEQEALLANDYVQGQGSFLQGLKLDFWGLPPEHSIGSYRPLPSLLWRAFGWTLKLDTPFFLHLLNLLVHALVASSVGMLAGRWLAAYPQRPVAVWGASLSFVCWAATSEAVCAVVGLADLLAALFTVLAILATQLPSARRELALFFAMLLGMLSKETALAALVLVPLAIAFMPLSPSAQRSIGGGKVSHRRIMVALSATVSSSLGVAAFVQLRSLLYPVPKEPRLPLFSVGPPFDAWTRSFFEWFRQPRIPIDPRNNPLLLTDEAARLSATARIFVENLVQLVVPFHQTGDYSYPRQPIANENAWLLAGAACLTLVFSLAALGALRAARAPAWGLLSFGLLSFLVAYLPVSNVLVLLPTIRAERLLYLPAIGLSLCLAAAVAHYELFRRRTWMQLLVFGFLLQSLQSRAHAMHYWDDVAFWRATRMGDPPSAKAQLNYGIMVGARGDLETRLEHTRRAVALAPDWAMAHVYLGDVLCRMRRPDEALAHYERGLDLAPNKRSLVALALQCLWDQGAYQRSLPHLLVVAQRHPGSWVEFLLGQTSRRHGGVPLHYRPRGYNERSTARANDDQPIESQKAEGSHQERQ